MAFQRSHVDSFAEMLDAIDGKTNNFLSEQQSLSKLVNEFRSEHQDLLKLVVEFRSEFKDWSAKFVKAEAEGMHNDESSTSQSSSSIVMLDDLFIRSTPSDVCRNESSKQTVRDAASEADVNDPIMVNDAVKTTRSSLTGESSTNATCLNQAVMIASENDTSALPRHWPRSLVKRPYSSSDGLRSMPSRSSTSATRILEDSSLDIVSPDGSKGIIHPASRLRRALNLIGFVALMYDLMVLPFLLAWSIDVEGGLLLIALVVSVYWTAEIIFSFRTAIYTSTGDLDTNSRRIAMNYLRGQFFLDGGIVVCDWVNLLATSFPGGTNLIRIMKVTRLIRLLRIANLSRWQHLEQLFSSYGIAISVVEAVKAVLVIFWVTHVNSCLWFAIGNMGKTDTGLNWVNERLSEETPTFAEFGTQMQYSLAIQWTLTSMISGTSPVQALNTVELLFCSYTVLVGLMIQAVFVSMLSSLATEQKTRNRDAASTFSSLQRFCIKHRISKRISFGALSQVRSHFFRKANLPCTIRQLDCLDKISATIQSAILFEIFGPALSCHSLFLSWSLIDYGTVLQLTRTAMSLMYFTSGHDVFIAGTMASEMYLVCQGKMVYMQDPISSRVEEAVSVEVVNEEWLCEAALWSEWTHVGTLEAECSTCEIKGLNIAEFLSIVASTTKFNFFLANYAVKYCLRLRQSFPPTAPWPDDIQTLGTKFAQVLVSMSPLVRSVMNRWVLQYAVAEGFVNQDQFHHVSGEIAAETTDLILSRRALRLLRSASADLNESNKTSRPSVQCITSCARVAVRRLDQRFIAQIGEMSSGKWVMSCRLPCMKQQHSETIASTVDRLLDIVTTITGNMDLVYQSSRHEVETDSTENSVLLTQHNILTCSYTSVAGRDRTSADSALPRTSRTSRTSAGSFYPARKLQRSKIGRTGSTLSLPGWGEVRKTESMGTHFTDRFLQADEIFAAWHGDQGYLFAWVEDQEFQFLCSSKGLQTLEFLSGHASSIFGSFAPAAARESVAASFGSGSAVVEDYAASQSLASHLGESSTTASLRGDREPPDPQSLPRLSATRYGETQDGRDLCSGDIDKSILMI